MEEIKNKIIFISPIDWGLGHASRSVPIIQQLSAHNTIVIGITNSNEDYFNFYFPALQKVKLPAYAILYSKVFPLYLSLIFQWPRISQVIRKEKKAIRAFAKTQRLDLIISDNRFGLCHPDIKSIFITHQLKVKAPFLSSLANRIHKFYIQHFNEVWVPDYEDLSARLAGELSDSDGITIPVKYIGPKSALSKIEMKGDPFQKIDFLVLLSGPEPQRTVLEDAIIKVIRERKMKVSIIRGSKMPLKKGIERIVFYDEVYGEQLKALIDAADTIICRSGYSTLMDMHLLQKKKLILVPTPGQTEQIYLAKYWNEKFGTSILLQNQLEDL